MTEPKLRFAEFKDEWKEHILNDYANKISRVNDESDAPVMMISSGNGFIYQADRYKKDNAGTSLKKYIELYREEFAYNHGYSKAKIYGSVFMLIEEQKARVPFVYHCFSIGNGYKPFFAILLNRTQLNRELVRYISSTARQDGLLNISFEDFMKVKIFVPSVSEQRKIAEIISSIDDVIAYMRAEVALWEEKKKGVMQKIFSQKVRFKKEDGSEYPEWEKRKLEEVVAFLDGKRKPLEGKQRVSGIYPYYGASGIIDYVEDYIFDEENILLSEDGANIINRTYRVSFLARGKYWVNNHAHVLHPQKDNNAIFICEQLESLDYGKYNSGSAQPKLNQEVCRKIPIIMPCIEEQRKIADCLSSMDEVIQIKKQKLETWKNIKKGLLQQMFV